MGAVLPTPPSAWRSLKIEGIFKLKKHSPALSGFSCGLFGFRAIVFHIEFGRGGGAVGYDLDAPRGGAWELL